MDDKQIKHIENLVKKAAESTHAAEAVNFAQAACNAANALRVLRDVKFADEYAKASM